MRCAGIAAAAFIAAGCASATVTEGIRPAIGTTYSVQERCRGGRVAMAGADGDESAGQSDDYRGLPHLSRRT